MRKLRSWKPCFFFEISPSRVRPPVLEGSACVRRCVITYDTAGDVPNTPAYPPLTPRWTWIVRIVGVHTVM